MTWMNRLKLCVGLIAVFVIVAVGTLIFNQRQNTAHSQSASLVAEEYVVGVDYGGTVTEQYVTEGDTVQEGDPLFDVRSLALEFEIASGYPVDEDLVTEDGTVTVRATVDGTVSSVSVYKGGFAVAGSAVATIDRADSLAVSAEFLLFPRDYARIDESTEAEIILPSGQVVTGSVTGIDVITAEGQALSTVRIESSDIQGETATGLFQSGTPVNVTVRLRDDGPLAGVSDAFTDLLRQIGL